MTHSQSRDEPEATFFADTYTQTESMKVCIPSMGDGRLEAKVSTHFGRAPNYTLYDTETAAIEVLSNDGKHHGGGRSPPEIISNIGADVLLCSNLGRKAVERFDAMEIDVYCGATGTVRDAIDQLNAGELEAAVPGGEYCGHEHEHGHGHEHGDEHGHEHGHGHEHSESHHQ